ncbi:eCIS core domain-containing protein [Marinobacterium rhizophilum]|uniref:DUF4157 domain-containing protein n=1 Tax=Marinobacterium rhizophilum TaxID=420402 RepID=A0ABY5HI90_9GAMM|nr:DUF4157 domain-containing protein [Marinobacterium rhizophilum]UTW11328.1 DUF4157 domain-containing protein [Marinobacterium rhizophilum]
MLHSYRRRTARWAPAAFRSPQRRGYHQGSRVRAVLQPALKIGQPNDRYEQQADRVASQVMAGGRREAILPVDTSAQRLCAECEEEEMLQTKQTPGAEPASGAVTGPPTGGSKLPAGLQHRMERGFGASFADVRIHTGNAANQSTSTIGARAYTVGHHIVFAGDEYRPAHPDSQQLLAHELTHVLQQRQGGMRLQRDLAREHRRGPEATQALSDAQVADAVAFNSARFDDRYMIGLMRDVLGLSRLPMETDDAFARAVGEFQAFWRLPQDGKLGHRTTHRLFQEFVAEGLFRDAVLLLIESYGLHVDRALNDISTTRAAAVCGPTFAHVEGGPHCGGGPVELVVCRNDLRTPSFGAYNLLIRIINHELVHVPQCARGTGNPDVDEFEAFFSEVCARGRMPQLDAAQRVASANSALTHFAAIPVPLRTAARTTMRDQLRAIIAAGGAGRC